VPAEVDVLIDDHRWARLGIEALASDAAQAALKTLSISDDVEISILAASDSRIAELNAAHRGKSDATNVLSWPTETLLPESPGAHPPPFSDPALGDIALAYETCAREATERDIAFSAHVTHLLIHGVLHLLGFDHETEKDAVLMEGLETKALETLGISNPYL